MGALTILAVQKRHLFFDRKKIAVNFQKKAFDKDEPNQKQRNQSTLHPLNAQPRSTFRLEATQALGN